MNKNYYQEMKDCLERKPFTDVNRNAPLGFFNRCQEYYHNYLIYDKLKGDCLNVLKYYSNDIIVQRKKKEGQKRKVEWGIDTILYAEFFMDLYNKKYAEQYPWKDIINRGLWDDGNIVTKILKDYYQDNISDSLIDWIKSSVYDICILNDKPKIDLEKLHNAMDIFGNAIRTPKPTIEESVNTLISTEKLEFLLNCLKANNEIAFIMWLRPVDSALTDGTYHKYTGGKGGCKEKFFNLQCEYNLVDLRQNIENLHESYDLYMETREELLQLK